VQAVEALRRRELDRLGSLFIASHASMRDDYAVSTPEIDLLVELACAQPEVFGARLTGGGFGGAVIALAHQGQARQVGERVCDAYAARSGCKPTLLVPPA
jgi:galactokinase